MMVEMGAEYGSEEGLGVTEFWPQRRRRRSNCTVAPASAEGLIMTCVHVAGAPANCDGRHPLRLLPTHAGSGAPPPTFAD